MSKERARRRAERLVVEEREKAARARRRKRRAFLRRITTPPKVSLPSNGRLYRRSRNQRVGIVVVPLIAIAAVWLFVPEPALRILLTVLLVLAVPALVVIVLGRRS
ncbi:hypothetical protein [Actinoplanes sp. NPDC051851]|uniref:hypothetical protein n=1 Tax=Actinoplanes sp. NPDC051851 TaxID=3154753 RepID=UPI0034194191